MSDQADLERRASTGEIQAMYELGVLSWESGDVESARGWHLQAAEGGHAQSMGRLGFIEGREGNQAIGRSWLEKAAEAGDALAMYNLGVEAWRDGGKQLAREWYEKAASLGEEAAMFNLGVIAHDDGNPQLAKEWYEKAVAHGVTDAFLNLGMLAQEDTDYESARAWYEKADQAGDPNAKLNLGLLDGLQGRHDTMREAVEEVAATGDSGAYFTLATIEEQDGDHDAALRHYERAAEGGVVAAMFNLGNNARRSLDYSSMRKWWRMGADHGDARCAFSLGRIEFGESFTDVSEQHAGDIKSAVDALERAAELGVVGAYGLLAQIALDRGDAEALRRYIDFGSQASEGMYSLVALEDLTADSPDGAGLDSARDITSVEAGSSVKLIWTDEHGRIERMWCQVLDVHNSEIVGYLDNNPVALEIPRGTIARFGINHILQVSTNDEDTAAILAQMMEEDGTVLMPAGMSSADFAKFVSQASSYEDALIAVGDLAIKAGSYTTAGPWYEAAARRGSSEGLRLFANALCDADAAKPLLETAANQGNVQAMCDLAFILEDPDGAIGWWSRGAELGHASCMLMVGVRSSQAGDDDAARSWWERSAALGEGIAMWHLARVARESGDIATARRWLEKATTCNDPQTAAEAREELNELDDATADDGPQ